MSIGLDVARVVNVTVNKSPQLATGRNFGMLCILGGTGVIPATERIRTYNNIADVGADFGVDDPEYKAAVLAFAQQPRPAQLAIACIVSTATFSTVTGIPVGFDASVWNAITDGGFVMTVQGVEKTYGGMDFSTATNQQDIVGIVAPVLNADNLSIEYTGGQYIIASMQSGPVQLTATSAPVAGTDISALLGTDMAQVTVGIDAETPVQAVNALLDYTDWYALCLAFSVPTPELLQICSILEAASPSRIIGITTNDPDCLLSTSQTDIAYLTSNQKLMRTCVLYSKTEFAVVSLLSRILTTDFTGSNTTITLKFKQLPTVAPEILTASQATALATKHANVFVQYNNNTAITQEGTMANGDFVDEVYGLDWLQNAVQTAYWNCLYGSTKVPQTNAGIAKLTTAVSAACKQAQNNGLLAEGQWNTNGFGALNEGDMLNNGYYIFAPRIETQSQAERETRWAPTLQIAAKMAGAIHGGAVIINVNR